MSAPTVGTPGQGPAGAAAAAPPAYRALALQTRCDAVNALADPAAARALMARSIERIDRQIGASRAFLGDDLRLIVLPEYFLSGFPTGADLATWQARACLREDGAEYRLLGAVARNHGVFLSGNAYEVDAAFPEIFFQVSFILDSAGRRVLCHRRLISMYTATPHDVWDRFLAIHGAAALLPVARTAIGNLACIASEEILFPEVARCLALNGAEVLLHSSSEVGSPIATKKGIARRARAIENLACVVSANSAGIHGTAIPAASTDGGSQVIDSEGRVLAEAGPGESMVANAIIDLAAARRARARIGMDNYLARLRTEPFAAHYARPIYPANTLADAAPSRDRFLAAIAHAIETLRPTGDGA